MSRWKLLLVTILVGSGVFALRITLGPQEMKAQPPRGSEQIAKVLHAQAPAGTHRLAAALSHGGSLEFGGLGADPEDEFEIGSVTKMFTIELLCQAIEKETVTAQTTVGEIAERRKLPIHGAITTVTLEELANHTSGLPRIKLRPVQLIKSTLTSSNPYQGQDIGELFDTVSAAALDNRGEEHYSNLGYALLGQLLAADAQTTWEFLVQDSILKPLGMTQTHPTRATDSIRGYDLAGRRQQPWDLGAYNPAGGLRSTADDMAKFARYQAQRLVRLDSKEPMGWQRRDRYFWHNGATGGFASMLVIDAETSDFAFVASDSAAEIDDLSFALLEGARS